MALNIEMKSKLKQETSKGKAKRKDNRGQRGGYGRESSDSRAQGEEKFTKKQEGNSSRGGRGRNSNCRGRSGGKQGRGKYLKCYHCNQMGHLSYRCPKKGGSSQGGDKWIELVEDESNTIDKDVEV